MDTPPDEQEPSQDAPNGATCEGEPALRRATELVDFGVRNHR
ncbi:MAG: hypothetical protein U0X73_12310 [Thermoanaerobaculia bacterium]